MRPTGVAVRNGADANAEFGIRSSEWRKLLRGVWNKFILREGGVYDPRYSGGRSLRAEKSVHIVKMRLKPVVKFLLLLIKCRF